MNPDLVERDPEIMSGALCFTGTRVPVQNLFDYLEGSSSLEEFLEDFPSVRRETAIAVLKRPRRTGSSPMRLLLDESVPSRLRRALPNHAVKTVVEMGWGGKKNRELLALACREFDALVTVDKNLP